MPTLGHHLVPLKVIWNCISMKKLWLTVSLEILCLCCLKILISVIVHTRVWAFWNQSFAIISNNSFPQQAYLISTKSHISWSSFLSTYKAQQRKISYFMFWFVYWDHNSFLTKEAKPEVSPFYFFIKLTPKLPQHCDSWSIKPELNS